MSGAATNAGESSPDPSPTGSRVLTVSAWLLAAFAYYPLVVPARLDDPVQGVEAWFFVPAEGSSGVIVLVAAWLLYRRWTRLAALPPTPAPAALAGLAFGLGMGLAFWANATGAEDLLAPSLLFNGVGLTLVYRGYAGLRFTWLPMAVLLLALPLPGVVFNATVFQFQLWTAEWAGWLLLQTGFTAHVSGDLIIRPEDTFAIIEGCSGMRSVEALSLLAVLLVDAFGRRGWHALLVVALAPGVGFLMNGFRVLTLIFNPHSEIAAVHNLQGVLILLAGLLLLVALDTLLERVFPEPKRGLGKIGASPPAASEGADSGSLKRARTAVVVLGICALAAVVSYPDFAPPRPASALNTHFSKEGSGWAWSRIPIDVPFLGKTRFRDSLHGRFHRGPDEVELFVGVGDQARRVASFFSPKTAFPGSGWVVEATGSKHLAAIDQAVEWRLLRSGSRRVLTYRWHRGIESPVKKAAADILALQSSPFRPRRSWDGFVVRITTALEGPGDSGFEAAAERLGAFSLAIAPTLKALEDSLQGKDFSQNATPRKNSSTSPSVPSALK